MQMLHVAPIWVIAPSFYSFGCGLAVWKCFGSIFQLPYILALPMSVWMAPVNVVSQYGLCRVGVATYILREIWVARCHATFEGSHMKTRQICLKVISRLQLLSLISIPKRPSTRGHLAILDILGISRAPTQIRRGLWCKWERPSPGWFKLNIDGSAQDATITGGGVIRNSDGQLVAAFSKFYGTGSHNGAELMALRDGIMLCKLRSASDWK